MIQICLIESLRQCQVQSRNKIRPLEWGCTDLKKMASNVGEVYTVKYVCHLYPLEIMIQKLNYEFYN